MSHSVTIICWLFR